MNCQHTQEFWNDEADCRMCGKSVYDESTSTPQPCHKCTPAALCDFHALMGELWRKESSAE